MNERIRQKIGRIRECLAVLGSLKEDCTTRFMSDPVYRGAVLHYLYQVADSCISMAELIQALQPQVGVDFLVYTPDEWDCLTRGNLFVRKEIFEKGKEIYAA